MWDPPFDLLPLVVRKFQAKGKMGYWFEPLRALSSRMLPLELTVVTGEPTVTVKKLLNPR